MLKKGQNKRAQVTIFIIIAVIIVAAVGGYFLLRSRITTTGIPANLEPVYNSFLSCVEEDALVGISVLESQGGYIELPEFEPGSGYMPFASQLDFLGNPIPYWYYVSGNNVQKEQVPSKTSMEEQLADYIESKVRGCLLDDFYEQGYLVTMGEPEANIDIRDEEVEINLDMSLALERANDTAIVSDHNILVKSFLGKLYSEARTIYEYEQDTLFLENYGIDTLRLYAPVDGVEMSCSPEIWNAEEVFDELEQAIEANTLALKVEGGDFDLAQRENRYFVVPISGVESNVLFLNSRNWSHSFEVSPSQESIMIAKPVGNQPGIGALGFCYVPYHFVYDVNYPVLVQVYQGEEIFQFPLAVVIQGNLPREALDTSAVDVPKSDLCEYKNTLVEVNTYDTSLNPIAANITFQCFGEICNIGEIDETGTITTMFPQCVNGFVIAESEGFDRAKQYVPTTATQRAVNIIMEKLYELEVNVKLDGADYNGEAMVVFIAEDNSSKTIVYPETKTVELKQGQYEVQTYIYRNASIQLAEIEKEECVEVPRGGLGVFLGLTEEKCFDIVIPEQMISNALRGGGKQPYYMVESELQGSTTIDISAQSLDSPENIEELQKNYIEFEGMGLDINFR